MVSIKEICTVYNINQSELSRKFNIPLRTIQNWYSGSRIPPCYVVEMMQKIFDFEKEKAPK